MFRWSAVSIFIVSVIIFADWVISMPFSCYEISQAAKQPYEKNNNCAAFKGPIVGGLKVATHWFIELVERNDKVITALSTVAIAFFTLTLWRATTGLLTAAESQKEDMRESLRIAKQSSDALVASEMAHIFVEIALSSQGLQSSPNGLSNLINLQAWNHGKTVAEVTKIRAYCLIQRETPATLLDFPGSEKELPRGLGIASNCNYPVPTQVTVSDAEFGELDRLEKRLFCLGRIEYRDMLDRPRKTGFCWELIIHIDQNRLVISRDSPYELSHITQASTRALPILEIRPVACTISAFREK